MSRNSPYDFSETGAVVIEPSSVTAPDYGAEISAKLDKIIELLETRAEMLVAAQGQADEPEEVDRGYLDG